MSLNLNFRVIRRVIDLAGFALGDRTLLKVYILLNCRVVILSVYFLILVRLRLFL